ncbi:hypothetical protein TNCV_4913271 [Trichonephila clavipes]|nr:hypothetical protein TNCV_4913271 [Trichonephila clavipes]
MGHLQNLVYVAPLHSNEDLVAQISEATARVREIPCIFERVRQSLHRDEAYFWFLEWLNRQQTKLPHLDQEARFVEWAQNESTSVCRNTVTSI